MKKIEDYLHLYLGCEVEFINQDLKESDYGEFENSFITGIFQNQAGAGLMVQLCVDDWEEPLEVLAREIKPILRPLSDMTEEEKELLIRVNHHEKEYPLLKDIEIKNDNLYFSAKDKKMKHYMCFSVGLFALHPMEFKKLLNWNFDLFDLIPSGLAIDKTTLK